MEFIKRLFIKDYKNVSNDRVRLRYGIVAGIFGIITNLLLFISKFVVGIICGSITIIADAINNLSDMGSSIIILFGFKFSSRPADSEHPFGHERFEQIMALIVAVIVFSVGVLLAQESITKIITPQQLETNIAMYIVLGFGILVKLFQMLLYQNFANSIKSDALRAGSIDSRNDMITTSIILIAMIIISIVGNIGVSLDGIIGLVVSIFIILSSLKLIKETVTPLIGQMPDKKYVDELKAQIISFDGVIGVHDLIIHSYGTKKLYASAHVEVDSKESLISAHDKVDNIERYFKEKYNILLSIHVDPVEVDNKEVKFNKEKVKVILQNLNSEITLHDFRLLKSKTQISLIFDVVLPYDSNLTKNDIKNILMENYSKEQKKHEFIIEIDRA